LPAAPSAIIDDVKTGVAVVCAALALAACGGGSKGRAAELTRVTAALNQTSGEVSGDLVGFLSAIGLRL
jgi:hypothetical protein